MSERRICWPQRKEREKKNENKISPQKIEGISKKKKSRTTRAPMTSHWADPELLEDSLYHTSEDVKSGSDVCPLYRDWFKLRPTILTDVTPTPSQLNQIRKRRRRPSFSSLVKSPFTHTRSLKESRFSPPFFYHRWILMTFHSKPVTSPSQSEIISSFKTEKQMFWTRGCHRHISGSPFFSTIL